MILFPPCKINIGLDIVAKRTDGYHDIETLMMPVHGLCDSLEIIRDSSGDIKFSSSGITVDCPADDNIAVKAWRMMDDRYGIGGVMVHLHKAIPFGAGLGGGSADAAYMLRGLNELFGLGLTAASLEPLAAQIGSDVPFFLYDETLLCTGRGEIMTPCDPALTGYHIVIVKPTVSVSTADAYAGVKPMRPDATLAERLSTPTNKWKECIVNAFERSVFMRYPELHTIKTSLYDAGAVYASMSGSGSAIYGIFDHLPQYTPKGMHIESYGTYTL